MPMYGLTDNDQSLEMPGMLNGGEGISPMNSSLIPGGAFGGAEGPMPMPAMPMPEMPAEAPAPMPTEAPVPDMLSVIAQIMNGKPAPEPPELAEAKAALLKALAPKEAGIGDAIAAGFRTAAAGLGGSRVLQQQQQQELAQQQSKQGRARALYEVVQGEYDKQQKREDTKLSLASKYLEKQEARQQASEQFKQRMADAKDKAEQDRELRRYLAEMQADLKKQGLDDANARAVAERELKLEIAKMKQEGKDPESDKNVRRVDETAMKKANEAAQAVGSSISTLQTMDSLLDNMTTGKIDDLTMTLRGFMEPFLGADAVNKLGGQQLFRALSNQVILGKAAEMKGSLSDKDVAFLTQMAPAIGLTKDANKAIIQANMRVAKRLQEYTEEMDAWYRSHGGKLDGWKEYANKKFYSTPLFSDEEKAQFNVLKSKPQAAGQSVLRPSAAAQGVIPPAAPAPTKRFVYDSNGNLKAQ